MEGTCKWRGMVMLGMVMSCLYVCMGYTNNVLPHSPLPTPHPHPHDKVDLPYDAEVQSQVSHVGTAAVCQA